MDRAAEALLRGNSNVPSEPNIVAALQTCERAADIITEAGKAQRPRDTAASTLLSLDGNGRQAAKAAPQARTAAAAAAARLKGTTNKVSDVAYSIIIDPKVFITPKLLEQYVGIQARLGRPESLPYVLRLYASKPLPRRRGDAIKFTAQNADRIANAVEPKVAEAALDAAIEAKNLDAAVGIVEETYATKAYRRNRVLRKALLPAAAFAAVPAAVYGLAANISMTQNTMDTATATKIAFAGMLGLRGLHRLHRPGGDHDNQRPHEARVVDPGHAAAAAVDPRGRARRPGQGGLRLGFSESHRWGEEEGAQFRALREFVLRKDMMLDRAELMEGING